MNLEKLVEIIADKFPTPQQKQIKKVEKELEDLENRIEEQEQEEICQTTNYLLPVSEECKG